LVRDPPGFLLGLIIVGVAVLTSVPINVFLLVGPRMAPQVCSRDI
jgi:hypothetical protein